MDKKMICPLCKGPVDRWGVCKKLCYTYVQSKLNNASESFRKANPGVFGGHPRPAPQLERHPWNEPLAALPVQKTPRPHFLVRITSHTRTLVDEDNLCEKYHLDLCRYSGIIPEDNPHTAHIETLQVQSQEEFTRIEIFEYEPERLDPEVPPGTRQGNL